jgi:hypothetical protein
MPSARKPDTDVVTIIGDRYCQPIADLVDKLTRNTPTVANRYSSGDVECGYSVATILLLVAMLESDVSRLRHVAGLEGVTISPKDKHALDVIEAVFPRLSFMKSLKEVYVLRDLLTHNHLWNVDLRFGGRGGLTWISGVKHVAYGDKKYIDRVNTKTGRTKALKLHVIPTRVDRTDTAKCFEIVWRVLTRFDVKFPLSAMRPNRRVVFRGQRIKFEDLLGCLTLH